MAFGVLSSELDGRPTGDCRARPSGNGCWRGDRGIRHDHIDEVYGHLQRLGGHLRQNRGGALANVYIANMNLGTSSGGNADFRLCFASNASLVNTQGHAQATAEHSCSCAIGLVSLPPANAFGPSQNAFPQAITGEWHPTFHRLIRQQLADGGNALTGLPGISDMTLQAIVARVDAQRLSRLINQHLESKMPQGSAQATE